MKTQNSSLENPMRKIKMSKLLLSAGGVDKDLLKAKKLLEIISDMKVQVIASRKRIPDFGVSPGLEVGTRVTIRGEKISEILKRLLAALGNTLSRSQISPNHFSLGITDYVDIPGMEYQRDIGIKGFNATIVFARAGVRSKIKKIKSGRLPLRQHISKDEIIKFMEENFQTKFVK